MSFLAVTYVEHFSVSMTTMSPYQFQTKAFIVSFDLFRATNAYEPIMRVDKIVSYSTVIILIAVLFAGAVAVPAAAQNNAMMFRYNAQHTGDYSPVAGNNASKGLLTWSFATGNTVFSSPAVVNGVVYAGSYDGNVYALNATTGAKLWNYTTGNFVLSSPAVVNGVVYVGSYDGNVYALNATTGAKLWNYTTGGEVYSSPAVANGTVYVGSSDNNLYALNASTGKVTWSFATGDWVLSSPVVVNGTVYVGSVDGNVYAIGNAAAVSSQSATPGFDGVLALVGLVIAAYVVRRRS